MAFRSSLSVRDLLAARDLYHFHLASRANVVGTAVGLWLFRTGDGPERRLSATEVRPDSQPCLLAFVSRWVPEEEFRVGGALSPQELLPETLYLRDGRTVPVCVVHVEPGEPAASRFLTRPWPDTQVGGGFGLVVHSQGLTRRASVGCLVTDGHTYYALTNRHVSGEPGQRIAAQTRGGEVEVGTSSDKQLTRERFTTVYPGFAGDATYLTLDAGLVAVDDANDWTASFYGIGDVGAPADLDEATIGLDLIDRRVVAYGAASGLLDGAVKALFYRYKSVGGWDYVADLMIAPRTPGRSTQPGDSGTVWHLRDGDGTPHPLAVEWGAQTFVEDRVASAFTLATNLSGICRLLDVEVVLEHNTAAQPFWGATGHYSIAGTAVRDVTERKLGPFLRANAALISFDRGTLAPGTVDEATGALGDDDVIPLADVPDLVFKRLPSKVPGGRDVATNVGPEHPTHYCDIDEPRPSDGKTLRALCMKDPNNVAIAFWQEFYDETGHHDSASRGCLPFRVWQFYDAMVQLVKDEDYAGYLTAAGLVSHYVGDACQPLHGSIYADGDPAQTTTHTTKSGHVVTVKHGAGVHTAYESKMIDLHAGELFGLIDAQLKRKAPALPPIASGHDAAVAIVALMDRSAKALPPRTLIEAYVGLGGGQGRATVNGLWEAFRTPTAKVMADGIRVLEQLWVAAWRDGGGAAAPVDKLGRVPPPEVLRRYRAASFVPSLDLDGLAAVLG